MRILATPEATRMIRDSGGMLFVRLRKHAMGLRAPLSTLDASTEPPGPEALDYRRFLAKDILVFFPPDVPPPYELQLQVQGWIRRRIRALWNGSLFVL
jgi:hypothetical protein